MCPQFGNTWQTYHGKTAGIALLAAIFVLNKPTNNNKQTNCNVVCIYIYTVLVFLLRFHWVFIVSVPQRFRTE